MPMNETFHQLLRSIVSLLFCC